MRELFRTLTNQWQYPDYVSVLATIVLQDTTFGGNWLKAPWDLSILFLPTANESTVISKLKF